MMLSTEHLRQAYEDGAENFPQILQKATNSMVEQIQRLKKIATEFSRFARLPTRKPIFISIQEVINKCTYLYSSTKDLEVKITTELEDNLPYVKVDVEELEQVIINLMENSIEAMPNGGTITIRVKVTKSQVWFEIEDTGIGIPSEMMSNLFQPNFSTKTKGTGLGLAISRGIIEAYQGQIEITSKVDVGTTVRFWLPRVPGDMEINPKKEET
jgi:two-component system, NtrC family, nitrogen regulation sensor histidine kinase NtrY